MHYLTLEEILQLHFLLIEDFGGSHGVRDEKRLLSVVESPAREIFGVEQYATVYEKAAVYMRNIIGDHPFADGNKRTGTTVMGVFLMRNGMSLTVDPAILEDFAVQVAVQSLGIEDIAAWLEKHTTQP